MEMALYFSMEDLGGRPRDFLFLPVMRSMAFLAKFTSLLVILLAFSKGKSFVNFIMLPFLSESKKRHFANEPYPFLRNFYIGPCHKN